MKLLVLFAQLSQDVFRLLGRGLGDVDLLETAHKTFRARKMAVVFFVSGRADEADAASLEVGLQHVRSIHRTFASGTGTHECVDLVDIDNVLVALFHDAVHDLLDAVFEIATILRTGQECANVELIDATALQPLGHLTLFNHPRQTPDEGRLAHTGLAHVQRIVLVATTKHLDSALQFLFAANQGVMALVEVVHAGDESSPRGLGLLLAGLFLEMVLEFAAADELAHEIALLVAQRILQQIAGPRLLQLQQAHHEMWQVEGFRTAVHHLLAGKFDDLPEL